MNIPDRIEADDIDMRLNELIVAGYLVRRIRLDGRFYGVTIGEYKDRGVLKDPHGHRYKLVARYGFEDGDLVKE